jgi:hypothetical protein
VIVTPIEVETEAVVTLKLALEAPAATVTLAGTVATLELLDRVTTAPPEGAAPVRNAVPCAVLPPTTLVGLSVTLESVSAAACGVKRRVDDQAPAVPAELMPRTRHQCRRPVLSGVEAVNCEAETTRSIASGAAKLFESSTWIR